MRGSDRVAGEVWTFRAADLAPTLRVLDEIECTNQPGQDNEYNREMVCVYPLPDAEVDGWNDEGPLSSSLRPENLATEERLWANVYFYARSELLHRWEYLSPSLNLYGEHYSIWPAAPTH